MVWEVYEEANDEDAVKVWTLYLVKKGESPDPQTKPFAKGSWFFGKEGHDPAGHSFYIDAYAKAWVEAARLNALPQVDAE